MVLKGKPAERRGRKATGLKRRAMTAGLPAKRKFFRRGMSRPFDIRARGSRRPGDVSVGLARALGFAALPADTAEMLRDPPKWGREPWETVRTHATGAHGMNVIIFSKRDGQARHLSLPPLRSRGRGPRGARHRGRGLRGRDELGTDRDDRRRWRSCRRHTGRRSWPSSARRSPSCKQQMQRARRCHRHPARRHEGAHHPPRCARPAPDRHGGHQEQRIRLRPGPAAGRPGDAIFPVRGRRSATWATC